MQWGNIKTLFILSFLILNIYLVSAFIDRQQDVGFLDNQELPIEDQLASEQITNDADPVDVTEAAYISVIQRELSDEDLEELDELEEQTTEVFNNNMIISEWNSPIQLSKDMTNEGLETAILPHVLYGNEYTISEWNEELNILMFFQVKEKSPIYYNENGLLLVYLNDDNEATHYSQTILGEVEVEDGPVQLNQPTQVIGQLFKANYLQRGDNVSRIQIGYYSRISAEGIQVFAPTWKVTVNESRDHFVNAIEGLIYESNETEFLLNIIGEHTIRMNMLDEENELRENFLPLLEDRLEMDNRSETE
ncbi:two-component system regulatory protein YycI [Oceanobacillus alkalisoli]|uniref:two-component system regulatory protein YycI n=1 Tax=Oceanobacillus alkalisoli TaxID=2925113 RepID=UPI001EF10722|nr:two-component system regulatory protein YycI [Oceanobacillus alkalisoli]MCF3943982.1 two-component system regulatory protein YycI [Oceanobacillus alkalisoli]MCG5103254.1 two-component system regulatory protein YycI [Oceanobacillus alkalisoli]